MPKRPPTTPTATTRNHRFAPFVHTDHTTTRRFIPTAIPTTCPARIPKRAKDVLRAELGGDRDQ